MPCSALAIPATAHAMSPISLVSPMGQAPSSDGDLLAKVNDINLRLDAVEQHVALLLDRGKMIS